MSIEPPPTAGRRPSRVPRPAHPVGRGRPARRRAVSGERELRPVVRGLDRRKDTGKHTPFVDVEIGCGEHRIDFKRPDLRIATSEAIVVKPGQTFKRRYTLPGGGAE